MEFLHKKIHSCTSLAVSYVTPLTTSLENFRSQLTLYLLLIGTFNHGRIIFYPLGTQPWRIAHSGPLQDGNYSPRMHMPGNLEVQTPGQNPSPQDCIPLGKPYCDIPNMCHLTHGWESLPRVCMSTNYRLMNGGNGEICRPMNSVNSGSREFLQLVEGLWATSAVALHQAVFVSTDTVHHYGYSFDNVRLLCYKAQEYTWEEVWQSLRFNRYICQSIPSRTLSPIRKPPSLPQF